MGDDQPKKCGNFEGEMMMPVDERLSTFGQTRGSFLQKEDSKHHPTKMSIASQKTRRYPDFHNYACDGLGIDALETKSRLFN